MGCGIDISESKKLSPSFKEALKHSARKMRTEPTPAEQVLWGRLRNRQLHGLKFKRQQRLDRFIVDFFCADCRLIVEVDGPIHQRQIESDAARASYLEGLKMKVLRFDNARVLHETGAVLEEIARVAQRIE